MKKLTIINLFLLVIIQSCYKPLPDPKNLELPNLTMVGENTFGCLANGIVWRNGGNSKGAYSSTVRNEIFALFYLYQKKDNAILNINGQMTYANTDQQLGFKVYSKDLLKTGTFPISEAYFGDFLLNKSYNRIDSLNPPLIQIMKLDTVNKITSGTFEGTIYTKDKKEKMVLKNGRFDVKIK